ncbi:MAG: glutamine--tRNA ligase, partial [Proteobacteria bacterium]|nr:glutamine--tRNA ligase [Pseudomonadota bacterium]
HCAEAEVRLYDRLFVKENPADEKDGHNFKEFINPKSLEILKLCKVEPGLLKALPGSIYQFERLGYFCVDNKESSENLLVFNRTVTLRDSWAKIEKKQ